MTKDRNTAGNSTYPKVAVQWLNQALCFYRSVCLVESEVLRNRHLRVAANRYYPYLSKSQQFSFLAALLFVCGQTERSVIRLHTDRSTNLLLKPGFVM